VLFVPGLRANAAAQRAAQLAREQPRVHTVAMPPGCGLDLQAQIEAVEREACKIDGPLHLVTHDTGALLAAHWAQQTRRPVVGALLAAPVDFDRPLPAGYPSLAQFKAAGWLPAPRGPLPFPSIVAASRNDPLAGFLRVAKLAAGWGSRLFDLGNVGHLEPAAWNRAWPRGEELITTLMLSPPQPA
jgi:predicted alpha/beta hydrolase family esterase